MIRYMKVCWIHGFLDEPVLIYSEIFNGREVRKIEEYRTGRRDFASESLTKRASVLAEGLMPTVDDLDHDPEFEPEEITQEEFESVWAATINDG